MNIIKIIKEIKVYLFLIFILFLSVWIINSFYIENLTIIDKNILEFINTNIQTPFITSIMKIITFFGSAITFLILSILFIFVIRKNKLSFLLIFNLVFVFLLNLILKSIYVRERPEVTLIYEKGYSLPSSHAMCSIAFYGLLIYFVQKYIKNKKIRCIFTIIFSTLILLIGFSRMYLNVHYMSDVLTGYLFGLLFMLTFIKCNDIINKG